MKHPTKQQVQDVIDVLKRAIEIAKDCPVEMTNGTVYHHPCGTPMCHGGWYCIGAGLRGNYIYGADEIALKLGFENYTDLEWWADRNEEIWGNEHGQLMFCDEKAFNNCKSLQDIIDHWECVKERLPE